MRGFHSTISRREFITGLGLAGVGLGATNAIIPTFHDFDELISSPSAKFKRPWFVKELSKPNVDIDWKLVTRFDLGNAFSETPEEQQRLMDNLENLVRDGIAKKTPGLTLRDAVFSDACNWLRKEGITPNSFLPPNMLYMKTNEYYNVPPWQGTPEDNLAMIMAALRFFGASTIGVSEITEETKRCIFLRTGDKKEYVFEDVDKAYETSKKRVIPNKCKWVVSYTIRMPEYTMRSGGQNTHLSGAAVWMGYSRCSYLEGYIQEFVRGLGYNALAGGTGAIGPSSPWALFSGLGEIGRVSYIVTPEHGTMVRSPSRFITDLPLAVTKPIEFGATRFCNSCAKCAEYCPSSAISKDKEPSWEITGPWNTPGYKAYRCDYLKCLPFRGTSGTPGKTRARGEFATACGNCMVTCVFQKQKMSAVHEVVTGVISSTSIFNGFFRRMDDAFGYGSLEGDPERWWHDVNQPVYGLDPRRE